jgi:hypothetical protein
VVSAVSTVVILHQLSSASRLVSTMYHALHSAFLSLASLLLRLQSRLESNIESIYIKEADRWSASYFY